MKSRTPLRICKFLPVLILWAIPSCHTNTGLGIRSLPGSPHPTDIEINSKSFLGTWSLTDINNELFNVTIDENGTARSNWSVDSIMGEFGTWTEYEGRWGKGIAITYRDGWRDLILAGSRGYEKASFKPRSSTKGWPNSFGIAVRLRGVRVPLSGVFSTMSKNGSQENVLNLKSNGLAQSSQRPQQSRRLDASQSGCMDLLG